MDERERHAEVHTRVCRDVEPGQDDAEPRDMLNPNCSAAGTQPIIEETSYESFFRERQPSEDRHPAPMLSVRSGAKAIEFYKTAFGAIELFRLDADSGAVVAQLSVEGAQFWLADESPEHFNFSPESLGGSSVRMVMTVDDPDGLFERAVAAGASVVWPVSNQHGWRIGRIVDPYGHHWEIGKPL